MAKLNDHKPASIGQASRILASRLRPSPFCWCGETGMLRRSA
ncbi:hypothetical protein ACLB1O_24020 [Escherichia coli]